MSKHIAIIGAGPGGLTAAMILARRGLRVTVFEKGAEVGGRNGELRLGDYRFDLGPTFLMMKFLLDEMFEEAGRSSEQYLKFLRLEPMYRLIFDDCEVCPTSDPAKMRAEVERVFPGQGAGLDKFFQRETVRYQRMYPCLQKDYGRLKALVEEPFLRALPHLSLTQTMYQVLGNYFEPEKLRLSFTFQSKYLGMSPWNCPGAFTMIPFVEYAHGIYHVMGGLSEISRAMERVAREHGADIRLRTPVKKVLVEKGAARGVELADGEKVAADDVFINADFAHAMTTLFDPEVLRKYTRPKLEKREFSCSTFMLYLGLDKLYPAEHHTIVFAKNYKQNLDDISRLKKLSDEPSFYVRNASINDPALAPSGHSALYVLVPVPNNSSGIDWAKESAPFRERVLDAMERRMRLRDLRPHIRAEKIITPADWQNAGVFFGATFNLAHTLTQMLYLRPHNQFEEIANCYLVGGGTHPGSGLPTIYESARISANLLCKKHGIPYTEPPPLKM